MFCRSRLKKEKRREWEGNEEETDQRGKILTGRAGESAANGKANVLVVNFLHLNSSSFGKRGRRKE
jgi:hypothetical protein